MSWCDKLASTPGVGFKLSPRMLPSEAVLLALRPLLDSFAVGEKAGFELNGLEPFNFTLTTDNGYQYGYDPQKTFVSFNYKIKVRPTSGGPPVAEMISSPAPFSALLPDVADRVKQMTLMLPDVKDRLVNRVGVVSTSVISYEDLPPGIARFIAYFSRPWSGKVEHYLYRVTSVLAESDRYEDRCVHAIQLPEDREELMRLQFDWHRTLKKPRAASEDSLSELLASGQKDALRYFEEIAEGNRFDEKLINPAT